MITAKKLTVQVGLMNKILVLYLVLLFGHSLCAQPLARTKFVIVHGAWGGSWAFKAIDSLLAAHGHIVYRPSLTGQGERVHLASPDVDLSTHITDVANMILFEDLRNIVLVGHSYGGMVITGVADRIPERISKLIYLDAFVPNDGENLLTARPGTGDWIKQMEKNGMAVPQWVNADQKPPKDVPQSMKTFTEPLVLKNPKVSKIPAVYILTVDEGKKPEDDNFYFFAQRARARGWKCIEMTADHNPQWSKPKELADLLETNR
jgi:pimeloyl-ACP methyl ester carboxylesterase